MDIGDLKYLVEPVKITKLSEAMRIGARIRPQCTGVMFRVGGSCALGAAYEALFGHPGEWGDATRQTELQNQLWEVVGYPHGISPIWDIGVNRNDEGQTREQIADWLESEGY